MTGRYDASYVCFLKGNANKIFTAFAPGKSGFIIDGDVKSMKVIKGKNGMLTLAAVNNDSLKVFYSEPHWTGGL